MNQAHRVAAQLADFFCGLSKHEQTIDVLKGIVAERCSSCNSLAELVGSNSGSLISRDTVLRFIAKWSNTAAAMAEPWVDTFIDMNCQQPQKKGMTQMDLRAFIFKDSLSQQAEPQAGCSQQYELGYAMFLAVTQQIEHYRQQQVALRELSRSASTVLHLLFPRTEEPLTLDMIAELCRECGTNQKTLQLNALWSRLLRLCHLNPQHKDITIKQFNKLMRGTPSTSQSKSGYSPAEFTPVRSLKQSDLRSFDRSTGLKSSDKKELKLELENVSREVKKKLLFDSLADVMLKKVLAFIIAVCRRDKEINALKADLFSRYGVSIVKLFMFLDTTKSEFVTSRQLECFFGEISTLIVYFYGSEGVLRFCDFVKLLAPLSLQLSDVQNSAEEELTPEILEKVEKIFKKMVEAELSNIKDIERLSKEFKLSRKSDLLDGTLFHKTERLSTASIAEVFERNSMPISEIELMLLFRKYDRDLDGELELLDFSPYLSQKNQ